MDRISRLETSGEFRDAMTEAVFLNTYGSPLLQALVGLGAQQAAPHHPERNLIREAGEARLRAELEHRFEVGGPRRLHCAPWFIFVWQTAASMSVASPC